MIKIFYENKFGCLPNILATKAVPNICSDSSAEFEEWLDYKGLKLDVVLIHLPSLFEERNNFQLIAKTIYASECDLFIGATEPRTLDIKYDKMYKLDNMPTSDAIKEYIRIYLARLDNKKRRGSFLI
jgi:hypothetical protein